MAKLPRPPGHHTVTPGFIVPNGAKVLAFLEQGLGGKLVERFDGPNGSISHAEVMLGDSVVMFGEPVMGMEPMPASLSFYVDDGDQVDAVYRRALASGATNVMEPKTQFYGYRSATVKDPGGNKWTICAIVEQVSPEEIQRRMAAMK